MTTADAQPRQQAGLEPIDDPEILRSIMNAISGYDLPSQPEWNSLDALSTHTHFEALEANPGGIFRGPNDTFQAVGDVYVTLHFGGKRDQLVTSDSYPARLEGTFDPVSKKASVNRVTIDTSSFFN